jgi:hypothetical protein
MREQNDMADFGVDEPALVEEQVTSQARELLVFAAGFDDGAPGAGLARRARAVAREAIDLAEQLNHERSARRQIQKRHEDYVAYHQQHCFGRDGRTRSGIPATAYTPEQLDEMFGVPDEVEAAA